MIEPVKLSSPARAFLTARKDINEVQRTASKRLATGLRVASILDDAQSFLRAQSLTQRVGNLREAKSDISQGIGALRATQNGTQAIESLTDQLKGIALAAKSASSAEKATLATQFDDVRRQIDTLAGDTSYQGRTLIDASPQNLDVNLSDRAGSSLTVSGQALDSASLGIGDAAGYNGFASAADVDNAIAAIDAGRDTVRGTESRIVSNASLLTTRETFTERLSNTLQDGADKLTLADVNQEAATLLSAQVRDSLALTSQRIAAQSDRFIVDLVRGA